MAYWEYCFKSINDEIACLKWEIIRFRGFAHTNARVLVRNHVRLWLRFLHLNFQH